MFCEILINFKYYLLPSPTPTPPKKKQNKTQQQRNKTRKKRSGACEKKKGRKGDSRRRSRNFAIGFAFDDKYESDCIKRHIFIYTI